MEAALSHLTSSEPILGTALEILGSTCITTFRHWQKSKSYGSPSHFDEDNLKNPIASGINPIGAHNSQGSTSVMKNESLNNGGSDKQFKSINAPTKQVQEPVRNQLNPSNVKSGFKGVDYVTTAAPLGVITRTGLRWMTPHNTWFTRRWLPSASIIRASRKMRHPDTGQPGGIQHCSRETLSKL